MSFMDLFNTIKYEKAMSRVKQEHFERVGGLEDEIHKQKLVNQELELKQNTQIKDIEHGFKLNLQEVVAKHEKELTQVKHEMTLEREKWEVEQEKLELQNQQKLDKRILAVEKEVFDKMKEAIEREAQANGVVVEVQNKIMDRLISIVPNVNKNIQEGSPTLKIDIKKENKNG